MTVNLGSLNPNLLETICSNLNNPQESVPWALLALVWAVALGLCFNSLVTSVLHRRWSQVGACVIGVIGLAITPTSLEIGTAITWIALAWLNFSCSRSRRGLRPEVR
jgi:hypothetical protein